jgi:hypothetical protein
MCFRIKTISLILSLAVLVFAGCGGGGGGGGNDAEVTDTVAPVFGDNGELNISDITSYSVSISWTGSSDDETELEDLQYRVFMSLSDNIDTVENIEAYGTPVNEYTAEISELIVDELKAETEYFFNVIVKDEAGNKTAYIALSGITLADIAVPGDVKMVSAAADSTQITLNWLDQSDPDLDHIEITWLPGVSAAQTVNKSVKTYSAVGLESGIEYTFTLKAVDINGNTSSGITFSISTISSGTIKYTYFIYTPADLNGVRGGVPGYTAWSLGSNYFVMSDINLAGYSNWIPLGNNTVKFTGNFNGNGHTIGNLSINNTTADYIGLFGCIGAGAVIRNVRLNNCVVSGRRYVAGLVGRNDGGSVSSCNMTGGLVTGYDMGGLVGYNSGVVTDCYSICNITEANTIPGLLNGIGGLVGENIGTISNSYSLSDVTGGYYSGGLAGSNNGIISSCYFKGNVYNSASASFSGGLVGVNSTVSASISGCYADANVTGQKNVGGIVGTNDNGTIGNSYSSGTVTGVVSDTARAGGLIGLNYSGIVNQCYSTATVNSTGDSGGLLGANCYNSRISNCYARGDVTAVRYSGGLVGYNQTADPSGGINNCYSTGYVNIAVTSGGLVGVNNNIPINSSYYDSQTSGMIDSNRGTPKTTAQMKTMAIFTGWDFVGEDINGTADIWSINSSINNGYPYLEGNQPN